jgi:hypothetical protein
MQKGYIRGYNESSKAYRIYIPGQRQIEVSIDVIFEEEIAFEDPNNLRWRLIVRRMKRQYLLPLQRSRGRQLLIQFIP